MLEPLGCQTANPPPSSEGKLNKFIKENTLMGQALITDPKNTVSNYISNLSKTNNLELNISSMDLYTI